ncbi:MAG TPA: hypothetical protein VGD67_07605 [Pseudonocardiaceae bacterium]
MDLESYVRDSRRSLLRFAVVLTDDPELAQDVVQDVSVDDPALIVAEFDAVGVAFGPPGGRIAFRMSHLPAGRRLVDPYLVDSISGPVSFGAAFADGELSVVARLVRAEHAKTQPMPCATGCPQRYEREFGEHTVQLDVKGFGAGDAERMLDSVMVAPDPGDPSTFFPLRNAFG